MDGETKPVTPIDLINLRERFHTECDLIASTNVAAMWDGVWVSAQRSIASYIEANPTDEMVHFRAMRQLETLAAVYRRQICDPGQLLLQSLPAQERMGPLWNAIQDSLHVPECRWGGDRIVSEAWRAVVLHRDWFEGWDTSQSTNAVDTLRNGGVSRWHWRPACNLYSTPHNLLTPDSLEPSCSLTRRLLALAGACETMRLLQPDPPHDLSLDAAEWCAYRTHTWSHHVGGTGWWDMERVAVERCGYPAHPSTLNTDDPDRTKVWRRPIAAAEQRLLACTGTLTLENPMHRPILRWLTEICGLTHWYLHVRWPPPFIAVMADCFAEAILEHTDTRVCTVAAEWDLDAIRHAIDTSQMHHIQMYSVWCLAGMDHPPTYTDLTMGWTEAERDALVAANGILTKELLGQWKNQLYPVANSTKSAPLETKQT